MKKYSLLLLILGALAMLFTACEDFTSSVDPFIDRVENDRLTDESQVPFLINGVEVRFSTVIDQVLVDVELLSDAMFFDSNLPGASYETFADIDNGDIKLDNSSVHNPTLDLGELRYFSDNLLERVDEIDFQNTELKNEALFIGNFYGGVARYFIASYFGLNPDEGGGPIDNGPFVPSTEMYQLAIDKFNEALKYTTDEWYLKVTNSMIARCYLYLADFANAKSFADNGMISGDKPFQSLHTSETDNYFWQQAGAGRTQAGADIRFHNYIQEDPAEANRVLIAEVTGKDDSTYYRQDKYPIDASPIPFMTWQENELMLAELELRAGNSGGALTRINAVRASHGIGELAEANLMTIAVERDKELCFSGTRLIDQRRLDAELQTWHLTAGSWKYLPIVERERNINPFID